MESWEEYRRRAQAERAAVSEHTAVGINGQLEIDGERIRISRKGALGFLTQGHKGVKEVYISDISSIQFKLPGALTSGYIQFSFYGGAETKGGVFDAANDENSVMFTAPQMPDFVRVKEAIERCREEIRQRKASPDVAADLPTQLERLASLRDAGVLTDEEFASAKRRLIEGA